MIFDSNNKVTEIGKILTKKHDLHGEFIGMMKLTKKGTDIFKRHFNRAKQLFWGKPFIRAATFEKAYLTDMIQDMVDMGVDVHCVIVPRGWKEIDTVEEFIAYLMGQAASQGYSAADVKALGMDIVGMNVHAEAPALEFTRPDGTHGIAGCEAAVEIRAAGNGGQLQIGFNFPVNIFETFHGKR